MSNATATATGIYIGLEDRNGTPVHIGDTLEFDYEEWWSNAPPGKRPLGPVLTKVELIDGEITCNGGVGSIRDWCTVVKRFKVRT